MSRVQVGVRVAGRFRILARAGEGGMGLVYRGIDETSSRPVAIKVLQHATPEAAARFGHEARALAGLTDPHVVEYVAHGVSSDGEPYLVMEWLEGESLDARLSREKLSVGESLDLARCVAGALGVAHAFGIVHRDIKPSNLFLIGGVAARVKVLDFGIARLKDATVALTSTGALLGTPGYMAPEQARGQSDVGAAADVFSLGCVLFECLTGRPAFSGKHPLALLAKLLLEEPPRIRVLRPDVPAELDALVAALLSKDPSHRPAHGGAVLSLLESIDLLGPAADHGRDAGPRGITASERRLVSVVAATMNRISPAGVPHTTQIDDDAAADLRATFARIAEPLDAQVASLSNGTFLAMLDGPGHPMDRAAMAARCALRVRAEAPRASVALATGRSEHQGRLAVGEALERAIGLLERACMDGPQRSIRIDPLTHALLNPRFHVEEEGAALWLRGERIIGEEARTLLGKPSLFCGRERELSHVVDLVEDGFADKTATAILVLAPAGMGKSRLRQEAVKLLRERHVDMAFALGRGDEIAAGSAYSLIAGALRGAVGIVAGEALPAQRDKIAHLVSRYVDEAHRRSVEEFLGELIGAPFDDEDRPRLRAARQDPKIMSEQIRSAYIELLRSITAVRPLLLVLEDGHWGDAPSFKVVGEALALLEDRPIAVVTFARPDIRDRFPALWENHNLHELRLNKLTRRAAEKLAWSALGGAADATQVSAIVDRSGGNAFYLEELVRALAEGGGADLPESVLGMVEARLSGLQPAARRLLRAASVFGDTFWRGGLLALLGGSGAADAMEGLLVELEAGEWIVRRPEPRFAGEEEYAFRHGLLREGAYAMLATRDRMDGHRVAGEWLERAGERNSVVLAQHYERGGEPLRAARHYRGAAEHALASGDLDSAVTLTAHAVSCGPDRETMAALGGVRTMALFWIGDCAGSLESALRTLELAEPGTAPHCHSLTAAVGSALLLRDHDVLVRLMPVLFTLEPNPQALAAVASAYHAVLFGQLFVGLRDMAFTMLSRMGELLVPALGVDPLATGWLNLARSHWKRYVERDPWGALLYTRSAIQDFDVAGDSTSRQFAETYLARDLGLLGAFAEAAPLLEQAMPSTVAGLTRRLFTAFLLLQQGNLGEAHEVADSLHRDALRRGDRVIGVGAQIVALDALIQLGEIDRAELMGATVQDPVSLFPYNRAAFLACMAEIKLRRGHAEAALELVEEALAVNRSVGIFINPRQDALPLLRVEALRRAGDLEGARQATREACDDILSRARRITAPEYRRSFLEKVAVHARTLELAAELLGP